MVREFVDRVFGGAAEPLVQHLVRDRHLTEDDLRAIATHLSRGKARATMNADMLAANIAAHCVQAGMVTVASLSAMRLLRVRASGFRLVALQLTLLTGLLLPILQPYAVDGQPQRPAAPVADVQRVPTKFFDAVVEVAPQPRTLPSVDPLRALLLVVVAGVALRLGWLTYGVIPLARFR